jgi:ADP-dependent NAD(P)H-hydrate dehydratase
VAVVRAIRRVPRPPRRQPDAHKGDCGTVLIVAGSEGMLGAAILAATAALRSGAGLVRVALPAALRPLLPLAQPCATTVARTPTALRAAIADADSIVVGPGLGRTPAARRLVQLVLQHTEVPVVLDADALFHVSPLGSAALADVPVVVTPHAGEAARLLGSTAADVQANRRRALADLCRTSGAICVLKGAGTLVGDGARLFQNRTGNAGLATGGTGDVLAGLLGGLLAQGMDAFDAACLAVHAHGLAGDRVARRLSPAGLIASDLPEAIAEVLR